MFPPRLLTTFNVLFPPHHNSKMLLPPTRPLPPTHQRLLSLSTGALQVHLKRSASSCPDQPDEAIVNAAPAFSNFRMLPPEVRIKIWNLALLPRLITITPRLNREALTCEVEVEAQRVELLYVCQESQAEVLKTYSQIKFNKDKDATTSINWSRDTIFLDLPDESVNVDDTMAVLGATFRSVQVLAIRMRTHVFWGFPDFLREASHLQKLIFVDEPERAPLTCDINGYLYLMDLGSLGFIRGCHIDPYGEYRYLQEEIWIKLVECYQNEQFDVRQWEMPLGVISWVRNLNASGERYCLVLPVT